MSALELALLLCLNVEDAQDFIDRCDQFDSQVEALYDLEERPRTIDDYDLDSDYLEDLLDTEEVDPCPCCVPQD